MLEKGLTPIEIIKLYSGNGTFMLFFALVLVFLLVMEKDKVKKAVLVFAPISLIVLFVFPLFANLFMDKLGEEGTYYRFLWLVPITLVSAYGTFVFIDKFKNKYVKTGIFAGLTICFLIGGVFMYEAPVFSKAENAYELPQCVIDMCDDMLVRDDREYEAVFPDEILQYPRLYSAYIVMPYGFEVLQFGTGRHDDLHDEMVRDTLNVEYLCGLCEGKHIHYIVINQNKNLDGRFEDYKYEFVGHYGDYDMYKSTTLNFGPLQ